MGLGRQAKTITPRQESLVLQYLTTTRHPERDAVAFLFSVKAGFRAMEIASVTWGMVMGADGEIANEVALENKASKGRNGGRQVPLHKSVRDALKTLHAVRGTKAKLEHSVIYSERGKSMSPATITNWFARMYQTLGMHGCSSHSGRRTFVTATARKIVQAGGSLRDVQQLAGHANLSTTQGYIEGSSDAKRRVVDML